MTVGISESVISSKTRLTRQAFLLIVLCLIPLLSTQAQQRVYLSSTDFLRQSFPQSTCEEVSLWLEKTDKARIEKLLQRAYNKIRENYCIQDGRTAWVLDEVGKTEPITSGIIINNGQVENVRVLEFRESRGAEVHRQVFTRQYTSIRLNKKQQLDRRINGISGATLSVNALNRQVRLALLLDLIRKENQP